MHGDRGLGWRRHSPEHLAVCYTRRAFHTYLWVSGLFPVLLAVQCTLIMVHRARHSSHPFRIWKVPTFSFCSYVRLLPYRSRAFLLITGARQLPAQAMDSFEATSAVNGRRRLFAPGRSISSDTYDIRKRSVHISFSQGAGSVAQGSRERVLLSGNINVDMHAFPWLNDAIIPMSSQIRSITVSIDKYAHPRWKTKKYGTSFEVENAVAVKLYILSVCVTWARFLNGR
ncbi:hypothetical protein B0H65DRAFT_85306 [Neurospora tetraspora]|uniref:Uncharacterized protein n=1 Tax=Neurospora tetraspora TaxID=94610 RepID=A0AAE0JJD2_9PEZI|nr:hypothetical protein B0H65DRAFT_85306 [Neurospora tetraspora]